MIQTSCQQQDLSDQRLLVESSKKDESQDSVDANESLDPPKNITGSYLQCTAILDNVDGQVVNRAGCQVVDKERGEKVQIENISEEVVWGFERDSTSNIDTDIAVQEPGSEYHAVYTFKANDGQNLDLGNRASSITVTFVKVDGTDQNITLKSEIDRLILEYIDSRIIDVFVPNVQ